MTPEQQLTLEITKLGIWGTILGTFLGLLFGFITALINRKWQKDDERKKELQNRLNAIDTYLASLVEACNKVRVELVVIGTVFEEDRVKSEGVIIITEAYKNRYEELRELIHKLHITSSISFLMDDELEKLMDSFVREVSSFVALVQYLIVISERSEGRISLDVSEHENKHVEFYSLIHDLYPAIKRIMDLYRLGLREPRINKNFNLNNYLSKKGRNPM